MNLQQLLAREREAVETALERVLPLPEMWPERLHRAMRYAVLAGGKRIRPILARLAHQAAGGRVGDIDEAICGMELIHTYSLVHDDLPALDDDRLRRGRATVHVEFDEATAILVGDALLTAGLLVLARFPSGPEWAARRAAAVELVAEAAGSEGMAGGQMEDLEATGQVEGGPCDPQVRLERIHRHKTGCLIRASVELGAVLAGTEETRPRFAAFGDGLGLAFQVADDILDTTATAEQLGKSPGKDEESGKLTYVTLYGLDQARSRLARMEEELVEQARELEGPDGPLGAIARYVVHRTR